MKLCGVRCIGIPVTLILGADACFYFHTCFLYHGVGFYLHTCDTYHVVGFVLLANL